jgi:hypothetical protein
MQTPKKVLITASTPNIMLILAANYLKKSSRKGSNLCGMTKIFVFFN